MALFGISDLHLSLGTNKPMDIFGSLWENHHIKILENWNKKIEKNDTVIIAGDISWAMNMEEAKADLDYIHNLNGRKILLRGNHDYWWGSITKLNAMYDDMYFIQNNHSSYEEYGICGTRGWVNLDREGDSEEHDEKIHKREIIRLRMSLDSALKSGFKNIIVMLHYPPITKISRNEGFLETLKEYDVKKVIYGHIHSNSKKICINGLYDDIEYICTSADIINFDPIRIL